MVAPSPSVGICEPVHVAAALHLPFAAVVVVVIVYTATAVTVTLPPPHVDAPMFACTFAIPAHMN